MYSNADKATVMINPKHARYSKYPIIVRPKYQHCPTIKDIGLSNLFSEWAVWGRLESQLQQAK